MCYKHPQNKDLLKIFNKIKYCYNCINNGMCKEMNNLLYVCEGNVKIDGIMENNDLNEIILSSFPTSISYQYTSLNRTKENWTIPNSVKKLIFYKNQWNEDDDEDDEITDENKVNIDMKYVENLILSKVYKLLFNSLNVDSLQFIEFYKIENIEFVSMDFKSIKKLLMIRSSNITFCDDCKIYNPIKIKIIKCQSIGINMDLSLMNILEIFLSSDIFLDLSSFENKSIYLESCYETIISENEQIKNEFQELNQSKIDSFQFPIPSQINEENGKKLFIMNPFKSYFDKFEIIKNSIVKQIEIIEEGECDYLISNNFYNDEDDEIKYMKFINDLNQVEYTENIRYFEIEVIGVNIVVIGFFDNSKYVVKKENHLGWRIYSIGYHGDDGFIFDNGCENEFETKLPYSDKIECKNIVGCGFDKLKREFFFTFNGKLVKSIKTDYSTISAAITITKMTEIIINDGQKPFKFKFSSQ